MTFCMPFPLVFPILSFFSIFPFSFSFFPYPPNGFGFLFIALVFVLNCIFAPNSFVSSVSINLVVLALSKR